MKIRLWINLVAIILIVLGSTNAVCEGQDALDNKLPDDVVTILPEEFDNWVLKTKTKFDETKTFKPFQLEEALLLRLKKGTYVSDDAVLDVLQTWLGYEMNQAGEFRATHKPGIAGENFKGTLRVSNLLIETLYKRPALVVKIYQFNADLLLLDNDSQGAMQEYSEAVQQSRLLSISFDKIWVKSLLLNAEVTLSTGDKAKAEKMYAEVLSYNWLALYNYPEALQYFRDIYIRAGKGIIQTRRNDLASLKGTFFYPSVMGELGRYKEGAIKEAEKSEADKLPKK